MIKECQIVQVDKGMYPHSEVGNNYPLFRKVITCLSNNKHKIIINDSL